jgi:hypothetical protein
MLLGPFAGSLAWGPAQQQIGVSTPIESCPLPPTTVVELDIDTSFENRPWHYGSAWTYADACPEVG